MRCQRCGKVTNVTTMSWFNTQSICMDCSSKEADDPRCKEAKRAEVNAVRSGNYNFKGIGL